MRRSTTAGLDGQTARLELEPLQAWHADEMVDVLAFPKLYAHIGGEPPTRDGLRRRFAHLAAGSPDPGETWCNWVMRLRADPRLVGYVQATLTEGPDHSAEVAWVVGEPWQGQGLATEAARWLLRTVGSLGSRVAVAYISPTNQASATVARRIGMAAGVLAPDGEQTWSVQLSASNG